MSERFTLITGRAKEQEVTQHTGRDSAYQDATAWMELNPQDMARLGIVEDESVRVQPVAACGETIPRVVELSVRAGKVPAGVAFVPLGPAASALCGIETDGTGMPLLKGLTIVVARRSAGQLTESPL